MDNTDYCSYELSMKLKKYGFDRPCRFYYTKENAADDEVWLTPCAFSPEDWNNGRNKEPDFLKPLCSAPCLWEAQKWLREEKKWHIIIEPRIWEQQVYDFKLWHIRRGYENANRGFDYLSYEAALSAGISAALELIGKEAEGE